MRLILFDSTAGWLSTLWAGWARVQAMRGYRVIAATSWEMIQRCSDSNCRDWPHYGGRGITVCERWKEFSNFLSDMGERPFGNTLDRVNVNGNYEPGNCRWATPKQQGRNKRNNRIIEHDGRRQCMAAWDEECGLRSGSVGECLRRGKPLEVVLGAAT